MDKDEIKQYLTDNLKIKIDKSCDDYTGEVYALDISISLEDDTISTGYVYLK